MADIYNRSLGGKIRSGGNDLEVLLYLLPKLV